MRRGQSLFLLDPRALFRIISIPLPYALKCRAFDRHLFMVDHLLFRTKEDGYRRPRSSDSQSLHAVYDYSPDILKRKVHSEGEGGRRYLKCVCLRALIRTALPG